MISLLGIAGADLKSFFYKNFGTKRAFRFGRGAFLGMLKSLEQHLH